MTDVSNHFTGTADVVVQAGTVYGGVRVSVSEPVPVALDGLPPDDGFTGRTEQLTTLAVAFAPGDDAADVVLVCALAGLAGVGKTALALQAARRFRGGVLFVDLHGYDPARRITASAALAMMLRSLGVSGGHIPPEQGAREALYRSRLATLATQGRRVLVVADNAADVDQVLPLRPGDPMHRMVVTSRHDLPIPSARRVEVDVLPESEAVALVRHALLTADPADTRIVNEPAAAAELAELCGFLPLALRIAAWLLVGSPEQSIAELVAILTESRSRLDELAYDDSVAVRAVFDASYQHLPADQARLFRLLSVNPGPHISLGAAAALVDLAEPAARRLLVRLRQAHLVQAGYRLHDLLRLYAVERCAQDEPSADQEAATVRLLDHYRDTARAAGSHLDATVVSESLFADRARAVAWLDDEYPNLVAAVEFAATNGFDTHARDIPAALGQYFMAQKYWLDWTGIYKRAAAASQRLGDRAGKAQALYHLGIAYDMAQQCDTAQNCYARGLRIARATGDRCHVALFLVAMAGVQCRLRQFDEAISSYVEAFEIFSEEDFPHGQASTLAELGGAYSNMGDYVKAAACYSQALLVFREISDRSMEAGALENLAIAHYRLDRFAEALDCYRQALAIRQELGDRYGAGRVLVNVGLVYHLQGRFAEAQQRYRDAVAEYEAVDAADQVDDVGEFLARAAAGHRLDR